MATAQPRRRAEYPMYLRNSASEEDDGGGGNVVENERRRIGLRGEGLVGERGFRGWECGVVDCGGGRWWRKVWRDRRRLRARNICGV